MTVLSKRLFSLLLVSMLSMTTSLAAAQDAPPETQLEIPMGDIPQPQANVQPAIMDDVYSPATSSVAFDPCPAPAAAINSSPDDLAKVQEDIDRFTLCVARAQLLERLNETALKSDGAVDAALGLSIPGVPNPQKNGLAPLPADALGGADVSPLTVTEDSKSGAAADNDEPVISMDTDIEQTTPKPAAWVISEIYGSGANIQATLISPEGDEMRVREGTKLRNSTSTVVRITPAVVTIRHGSDTRDLDWSRQGAP